MTRSVGLLCPEHVPENQTKKGSGLVAAPFSFNVRWRSFYFVMMGLSE